MRGSGRRVRERRGRGFTLATVRTWAAVPIQELAVSLTMRTRWEHLKRFRAEECHDLIHTVKGSLWPLRQGGRGETAASSWTEVVAWTREGA